jgi:hypothetical protein
MRVVPSEVVEEDGDFERLLQAEVALVVRRTAKRAGEVAVIANLLEWKKNNQCTTTEKKKL